MLALVVVDLLPDAWKHASHAGLIGGTAIGALLMVAWAWRSRSDARAIAGTTRALCARPGSLRVVAADGDRSGDGWNGEQRRRAPEPSIATAQEIP